MIPKGNAFIELYQFINYFVYSEENYSNSKNMIKDSISVYNEIINKINLYKKEKVLERNYFCLISTITSVNMKYYNCTYFINLIL